MANNFLQFCPTDTGTNLETQAAYAANTDRTSGNKPGIAASKLNNKALRQANFIASQVAQLMTGSLGADLLDDADNVRLLAQMKACFLPQTYTETTYGTPGTSGTHNFTFIFFCASANATIGATYTNNGVTFTVKATIAAGLILRASGANVPLAEGTLTKTAGTGDATIAFYAMKAPRLLEVIMTGGGGGGSGSGTGTSGGAGGNGGDTLFGTFTAGSGIGAVHLASGGAGGAVTFGGGALGLGWPGGVGNGGTFPAVAGSGGGGGINGLGGAGVGGYWNGVLIQVGGPGRTATGAGGGGASGDADAIAGSGGGAGGYIEGYVDAPSLAAASYTVGVAGTAGAAGTGGTTGGAGSGGLVVVREIY